MEKTDTQRGAYHLYFELLAETLTGAGLDMKKVLKPEVDIPWTKDSVKTFLWKPLLKAMTNKDSTEDMTSKEVNEVYEVLDRHLAEKFGVSVDFPSEAQVQAYKQEKDIKKLFNITT